MDNANPTPENVTAASSSPRPPLPDDEVDWTGHVLGEFRLLHRLGRGGMGQVYLAEQTSLKRKVALKLLHPELASNERSLLRFKAEAENVARATHANIVQIYTIGQANGVNYLALEYVEGKNLREFIEKKGIPELANGLHIMMQIAAALQRASELGIIHRDIKPENILLTKKGEVKVADFGLSRCFAEEGQQTITQSQVTMGTPLYMSPEQVERKTVDIRTDIYSFGVTCYHMFAGVPPFRGASPLEVAYQQVHKEPHPLQEIRPDLPAELCAIIQVMMAKKPEDRYQTAGEILRDLNLLRESLNLGVAPSISISSTFINAGSSIVGGAPTQTWPEAPRPIRWVRRIAVVVGVLLALSGGLALGWYQHHRKPATVIVPPDDPIARNKPALTKEDEKEMQRQVQKYLHPANQNEVVTGVQHSLELGMYYLKENRLDDADQLFNQLSKPDGKVPAYRFLGKLGHAVVLAFKDESAASNDEFLSVFGEFEKLPRIGFKKDFLATKEEFDAYKLVWKENKEIRELVAQAIQRNFVNSPNLFAEKQRAEKLNALRFPPRPTLKGPNG